MTKPPSTTNVLQSGREAASDGDWERAYRLLAEGDSVTPLAGDDLVLLANAAYAAGHLDRTIEVWERIYRQSVGFGNNIAAAGAAVRVAMHLLFDTALLAPVRGWLRRAGQLLEGCEENGVHAWFAVVQNYERLLSGDFETARGWARRAIEVGTRHDAAAAAIGRVAEARSLVFEGDVASGLALLEEAALASVSGELDPLMTGMVYCEVICALQGLGQGDAAEEWTEAMERWRHGQPVGSVHGRCRVHRAEVLRLRGSHVEAEKEALTACDELRPYLRREFGWPLTELGRIRLRMGDIEGAEKAFVAAHEAGWDPQPGLALVRLAQGDTAQAALSVQEALDHPLWVPSKEFPPNTELRRAPLLEAQVEIEIAMGDLKLARAAAEELSRIAERFASKTLAAGAALARGRLLLAEGEIGSSRREFESSQYLWSEVGAPYETAEARLGLARALRADKHEQAAVLEFLAAGSVFERIGARNRAAEAAKECEDNAPGEKAPPLRGSIAEAESLDETDENIFRSEGDYWLVAFGGRTTRVRDQKGLRYIARLLAEPRREFHVLDLVALEKSEPAADSRVAEAQRAALLATDAGELLDVEAKAAYRRRLAEIDEDIEDGETMGDLERVEQARSERDFLMRELSRAVGLGQRSRRAGSAVERARASVTRAIRQTIRRVGDRHSQLGDHLGRTIQTGRYCSYLPDPTTPIAWNYDSDG